MHGAKFAHRDLKPENVMVTKELKLKVIDLGFAADLSGRDGSGYTVTRKGTRMYMDSIYNFLASKMKFNPISLPPTLGAVASQRQTCLRSILVCLGILVLPRKMSR